MTATALDDDTATEPAPSPIVFEIKAFVLRALLDKAASVVPSKDLMPVLKNFQVELTDEAIRVTATDLELSVISTTELVAIRSPGVCVLPAKTALEIMREAEDGDVSIVIENGEAAIRVGSTAWNIRLQDGSDYPPLPNLEGLQPVSIDRVKFMGALHSVRYAASTATTRANLMLIDITAGKMRASDGNRFQQVDLGDFPLDIQIPIGAVDDLIKILRSTEAPTLDIAEDENHIVFRVGTDVFIVNKLVTEFPDVEAGLLRPALENKDQLIVDRQDLVDAVKRVRITADPETSAIVLRLDGTNSMTVEALDKFGNRSHSDLSVGYTGAWRTLAVNHKFLLDMLTMADGATCSFYLGPDLKTRKSAILLRDDAAGMVGIVQQMRADWLENSNS